MTHIEPFDGRPDAELGASLRLALGGDDGPGFTRRVLAALEVPTFWDVLATWARPGLAAGLVLLALLGFWAAWQDLRPTPESGTATAQLETGPAQNGDGVMAIVLGGAP